MVVAPGQLCILLAKREDNLFSAYATAHADWKVPQDLEAAKVINSLGGQNPFMRPQRVGCCHLRRDHQDQAATGYADYAGDWLCACDTTRFPPCSPHVSLSHVLPHARCQVSSSLPTTTCRCPRPSGRPASPGSMRTRTRRTATSSSLVPSTVRPSSPGDYAL